MNIEQNASIVDWIQQWYINQCDGEWEHEYGIKVYTVDNPGWSVVIDLNHTTLEDLEMPYQLFEKSEDDWYGFSIQKNAYKASGDPTKLELLLKKFKEIVDANG